MFISLFLFFLSYFGKIDDIEIELGNGKITCPKKKEKFLLVFIFISFHFISLQIYVIVIGICAMKKKFVRSFMK